MKSSEKSINYTALGKKIRNSRKKQSITQEQLAEACCLSVSYIGHIERGTRIPSLETLCKISSTLGISLDYMLMDSLSEDENLFHNISASLKGKEPTKVSSFISTVKILAEKIDDM